MRNTVKGEPFNQTAKDLLCPKESFDPLRINNQGRLRAFAVFVASIVLSLALTEYISPYGIRVDLSIEKKEFSQ